MESYILVDSAQTPEVDKLLITYLTTYLAIKYPDDSSSSLRPLANHLACIVQDEIDNFSECWRMDDQSG